MKRKMWIKPLIIAPLLILTIGSSNAQYGKQNFSNEYVQNLHNIKPSKEAIDLVKKEQDKINNGAIHVIDNSKPGRWEYETTMTSSLGENTKSLMNVCVTKEMINEGKLKNIAKMFIPEEFKVSCSSQFSHLSSTTGDVNVTCATVENKINSGKVLVKINGRVISQENENLTNFKVDYEFIDNKGEVKEVSANFITKGERVDSCTTYDVKK